MIEAHTGYCCGPLRGAELADSPVSIRWRSHSSAAISQRPNSSSELIAILLLLAVKSFCLPDFGVPCIGPFPRPDRSPR
jgi:hypothetical protein